MKMMVETLATTRRIAGHLYHWVRFRRPLDNHGISFIQRPKVGSDFLRFIVAWWWPHPFLGVYIRRRHCMGMRKIRKLTTSVDREQSRTERKVAEGDRTIQGSRERRFLLLVPRCHS